MKLTTYQHSMVKIVRNKKALILGKKKWETVSIVNVFVASCILSNKYTKLCGDAYLLEYTCNYNCSYSRHGSTINNYKNYVNFSNNKEW